MNTSAKRVGANALWSLMGQVVPMLIALLAVPVLISQVGLDRFGFFSLVWAFVGYASLFDMGISRAATRLVATRLAEGRAAEAHAAARGALVLMTGIGTGVGVVLFLAAGPVIDAWLKVPGQLRSEAVNGMRVLAVSLPLVLAASAYRGTLEGWQQFRPLSLIRIVMGVLNFGAPVLAALFWPRIEALVLSLLLTRALTTWMHARAVVQHCQPAPETMASVIATPAGARRELLTLGGWMSVSNVLAPLMGFIDRFVLGSLVPLAMVSAYTAVFDMVGRVLVLPYALMSAMFPMMAGQRDADGLARTYGATARLLMATMMPVMLTLALLAHPLIVLWLGPQLADSSAPVLQILAIGVLANALAQAPANLIQSSGNPRTMAVLHMIELPLMAAALWWATERHGIVGTAWCWTGRMLIDGALLYLLVNRHQAPGALGVRWLLAVGVTALLLGLAIGLRGTMPPLLYSPPALLVALLTVWFVLLTPDDRALLHRARNQLSRKWRPA